MYTMTKERWQELVSGQDCPFCERLVEDKYKIKVRDFSVSTLYFNKSQTYPGYCFLIFNARHATKMTDLTPKEYHSLNEDLLLAQQKIEAVFSPDHMNLATLGNQIAHLHWHIIPRYEGDPRWGAPVWMNTPEEAQKKYLSAQEYEVLIEKLKAA